MISARFASVKHDFKMIRPSVERLHFPLRWRHVRHTCVSRPNVLVDGDEGRGTDEERVCAFSWLAGTCTETSLHPDGWAKRAGCLCLGGENLGLLLTLLPGNNHALSPPTGVMMSGEIKGNTFAKHKNRRSISHTCTLKHAEGDAGQPGCVYY